MSAAVYLRVSLGMILIMLEPVSGISLLNSAFEPSPPLSDRELKVLLDAKVASANAAIEAGAKNKEADEKARTVRDSPEPSSADKPFVRALFALQKREVELLKMEAAYLQKDAELTQEEADESLCKAELEKQTRWFELERARLRGTELVEMVMAAFEDIPEIGLAIAFVVEGGMKGTNESEQSLFITSLVISIFHAAKCFWSFWTLRKTIRSAKKAETQHLDTYHDFFELPERALPSFAGATGKSVPERRQAHQSEKIEIALARQKYGIARAQIATDAKQAEDEAILEEIAKLVREGEQRKAAIAEEKKKAAIEIKMKTELERRAEEELLKAAKLPEHWEKKVDKETGRTYFKNHKTRHTTWIDPRTNFTRKQDAAATVGADLPYGWDVAETNGEQYFIDHLNQKTHWVHPRFLLEEKQLECIEREEETQIRAQTLRDHVKDLRAKRALLTASQLNAGADEEGKDLQKRVEAIDVVIDAEMAELNVLNGENQQLKDDIEILNNAFAQAAHVAAGGV